MAFNLVIPNPKKPTVKDVILKELSMNKALTIPKLLSAARKSSLNVSYHAVYQAIKELKTAEVLEQNEKEYMITKNYISSMKDFVKILEENHEEKINLNLQPYSTIHLSFDSLNEATLFAARAAYSNFFNLIKDRSIYIMFQHLWLIQTIKNVSHLNIVKKIAKLNKWYALIQGNSKIDDDLSDYYRKNFNADIKTGVKCAAISNVAVSGEYIIESFIPKKLIALQEKVFNSSNKGISLEWIEEYTKLCYFNKYKINATITRNKELAEQIKENIKKHFT